MVHNSVSDPAGGGRGLWENNRIAYGAAYGGPHLIPGGGSGSGTTLDTPYNIYRYNEHLGNAMFGMRLGSSISGSAVGNKIYNNTFYHNGYGADDDPYAIDAYRSGFYFYNTDVTDCALVNNLFYDHWSQNNYKGGSTYHPAIGFVAEREKLLASNEIHNNYVNSSTDYKNVLNPIPELADPLFKNPYLPSEDADYESVVIPFVRAWPNTRPDLSLQADSPAIDGGTHLTKSNGSGANSTTLLVDDALYFQDGSWGSDLAKKGFHADWICVGTVKNCRQISAVNYDTNTITLSAPMTWDENAPIWLYKKSDGSLVLTGSAPDYGAHEYTGETVPSAPKSLRLK